jgi:hypothetical protein
MHLVKLDYRDELGGAPQLLVHACGLHQLPIPLTFQLGLPRHGGGRVTLNGRPDRAGGVSPVGSNDLWISVWPKLASESHATSAAL